MFSFSNQLLFLIISGMETQLAHLAAMTDYSGLNLNLNLNLNLLAHQYRHGAKQKHIYNEQLQIQDTNINTDFG